MQEAQATFLEEADGAPGAVDQGADHAVDRITAHEEAAHEKRNWVRLTSFCNNRCTFCLDSAAHNGTFAPRLHIRDQIIHGRRNGATRLILSGGEPTIHPSYVEFIDLGKQLGYRRIQTVTNGRMFSYPEFLQKCLDAGLGEITFSVHGHNAKVHDALVGVKGAYEEEIRGLRAALADGRPIINIDVCLNRGNIKHLPEMLEGLMEIGVREFDLLHIIPFGRAYEEGRDTLFYDIDEAMPGIRYALELSQRPDLHIWFNRFPPPYLEGYEHLIQDPYKLNDEVRGRAEEYERLLSTGIPLSCRQRDRCQRCYLENLCDTLDEKRDGIRDDSFDVYRADVSTRPGSGDEPQALPPAPGTYGRVWLLADDAHQAAARIDDLPAGDLILDLRAYDDFDARLEIGSSGEATFAGRRVVRAYARRIDDIERLLAIRADFDVCALLARDNAAHLAALPAPVSPRLVIAMATYGRLTEARANDPDFAAFFAAYDPVGRVEGFPACISGRVSPPSPRVLDAEVLDAGGRLEIFGYARRFIVDHYTTKSARCRTCTHVDACEGAHINTIRAHGYAILTPVEPPEGRTPEAAASE